MKLLARGNRIAVAAMVVIGVLAMVPVAAQARWRPQPSIGPWQLQLQGRIDRSIPASVFETDGDSTSRATVNALHRRGARITCYLDAGSWESYRRDRTRFPRSVLGRRYAGYPNERWLDIRRFRLFGGVIRDRVKACRLKGFDGVEFDNVNAWENQTGFPITPSDQLRYNRWLAGLAHGYDLAAGLKNDGPQVGALVDRFDFAVVEQCFQYDECGQYRPFIERGKAVFSVEYDLESAEFCGRAAEMGFSAIAKRDDLFALPWVPCPPSN